MAVEPITKPQPAAKEQKALAPIEMVRAELARPGRQKALAAVLLGRRDVIALRIEPEAVGEVVLLAHRLGGDRDHRAAVAREGDQPAVAGDELDLALEGDQVCLAEHAVRLEAELGRCEDRAVEAHAITLE